MFIFDISLFLFLRFRQIPVSLDATRENLTILLGAFHLTDEGTVAALAAGGASDVLTGKDDQARPPLPMPVLFDSTITFILRLVRLLGASMPLHATVVGGLASGRRCCVRLAAYVVNHDVRSVTGNDFLAILKPLCERLGLTRDLLDEDDSGGGDESLVKGGGDSVTSAGDDDDANKPPVDPYALPDDDDDDNDEDNMGGEDEKDGGENGIGAGDDNEDDDDDGGGGGQQSGVVVKAAITRSAVLMASDEPESNLEHEHFVTLSALMKVKRIMHAWCLFSFQSPNHF